MLKKDLEGLQDDESGVGVRGGSEVCVGWRGEQLVEDLYLKLLNPAVGKLYEMVKGHYGEVRPVIYTMGGTFLGPPPPPISLPSVETTE